MLQLMLFQSSKMRSFRCYIYINVVCGGVLIFFHNVDKIGSEQNTIICNSSIVLNCCWWSDYPSQFDLYSKPQLKNRKVRPAADLKLCQTGGTNTIPSIWMLSSVYVDGQIKEAHIRKSVRHCCSGIIVFYSSQELH